MLARVIGSRHWKLASFGFAVLLFLVILLAEDGDLRTRLEGFTRSAKMGIEGVQLAENFGRCVFSAQLEDGLMQSLCGYIVDVTKVMPHFLVRLLVGTPGGLVYALTAGFNSGVLGVVFSALLTLLFIALVREWLMGQEKNLVELVGMVATVFLFVYLVKLLIVSVLSAFGWLVQFIGVSSVIVLGIAKALDVLELTQKAREFVSHR